MKKKSTTRARPQRTEARPPGMRKPADLQVREFSRKDLGRDIRQSGAARVLRRRTRPTSILLDQDLIEKLRAVGAKRGLGYQTMLKLILREKVDEYA